MPGRIGYIQDMESVRAISRQMKLFHLESPLLQRLGSDFFRSLPSCPGVYFFFGSEAGNDLLYIGQSGDLRARLTSYRHVTQEKNARRTLRLVQRVRRIEWRACATPAKAVELERVLLLEYRPPFNRAGVWQGEPWWLHLEAHTDRLCLGLNRGPEGIGPLPSGFRHALGSLVRCLYRGLHPELSLADFPHGVFQHRFPLRMVLPVPQLRVAEVSDVIQTYVAGDVTRLDPWLEVLRQWPQELERITWEEEADALKRFAKKLWKEPTPAS